MRVLIAGGGTGGHLFPALALAEAFQADDSTGEILFVGTNNPLEVAAFSKRRLEHVSITVEGLKGRGVWRQLRSLAKIPRGLSQSIGIIRRFRPDMIIGVGGYASGPVVLAARLMGKKVAIQEQNLLPGLTNRILARMAHRVFISFPDQFSVFENVQTVLTGNPVRGALLSTKDVCVPHDRFCVLVVGGSQGARAINRTVVEALPYLHSPREIRFVHQTGEKDAPGVTKAYEEYGIAATVAPFFEDMASVYGGADLVICRAGATTVAELTALGKPAVFIPFPFAANNHQEFNARYVAEAGGAEVILEKNLDGRLLAEKIEEYAFHRDKLRQMSLNASSLGRPEAARRIVEECRRLIVGEEEVRRKA